MRGPRAKRMIAMLEGAYATHKLSRPEAEDLIRTLKPLLELVSHAWEPAGSFRRGKTHEIGDLDFVLASGDLNRIPQEIGKYLTVKRIARSGKSILTLVVLYSEKEIQLEFNSVPDSSFGAALLHSTGSAKFNVQLRKYVTLKGFDVLNQYGLAKDGKIVASTSETDIFSALGFNFIPPEERNLGFFAVKDKYRLGKDTTPLPQHIPGKPHYRVVNGKLVRVG